MKKILAPIILLIFLFSNHSIAQQGLQFSQCQDLQFEINDHSDTDNDGNVCEAKIVLSKSASYSGGTDCQLSEIEWIVYVDLLNDGVVNLEYSSSLPSTDNDLDDTNGNGIPDLYIPSTLNNGVQNISLPDIEGALSMHNVEWKVFDSCDNEEECQSDFQVVDKRSPTPYCVALSTIVYNGTANEVYAEDFNVGSFDNCTPAEELVISFSPDEYVPSRVLTCEDVLNSPVEVDVFYSDLSGNTDFCRTNLYVVPGNGADCGQEEVIFGKVKRWSDDPLEGVKITLNAPLPQYPIETYTDANGNYSFGYLPQAVDYTLSASKEEAYVSNVSTLDLVLILRHILGLQSFTNPYRILAADVNGDGQLKASDLLLHRKLLLGVISEINTNEVWDFVRSDFDILNPLNPTSLLNSTKDQHNYEFNSINPDGYDFIGAKTGDISN